MIPIRIYIPTNPEGLKYIYERLFDIQDDLPENLPGDPIHFAYTMLQPNSIGFLVGGDMERPEGLLFYNHIARNKAASAHLFIWGKEIRERPQELVDAAQRGCMAVMKRYSLVRLNANTPATLPHVIVFAKRVGFKTEGMARKSTWWQGKHVDSWIGGLLHEDLEEAVQRNQNGDRIETKE